MTLVERLTAKEGLRLKPYKDTKGKWTIGIGRNFEDVPFSDEEKAYLGIPPRNIFDGITKDEALYLLHNDIQNAIKEEEERFDWFDNLDNIRKEVVTEMIFNMGIKRFCGFKHMIAAIKINDFNTAADELKDSDYYRYEVGERAIELETMLRTGYIA